MADHDWENWKMHCTSAIQENQDIQKITGGGIGFAGNALEDDLANQLVTGLDNLTNATVQKNETIEKLTEMNHQKENIIVSLTKSLEAEKLVNGKLLGIISSARPKAGAGNNNSKLTGGN
jgi:hypothetical protein